MVRENMPRSHKMVAGQKRRPDARPTLYDRMTLWLSSGRRVDGLWVGTYFQRNAEQVMRRVEEALRLIKTYDQRRYKRLISDVDRVWVRLVPGGLGKYTHSLRACELDERFVLAETSPAEMIAATIVHEATHARLRRCGIGYDENIRGRVEAVCIRREQAFARKLPNGEHVYELAQDALAMPPTTWTDTAGRDRDLEGSVQTLRHLGAPNWVVRALLAARAWRSSIRRRSKTRRQG
jgi:hypothetical protein